MALANSSPSEVAMQKYIDGNPGFREVRPSQNLDIPTLPQMKEKAQNRRTSGKPTLDQSAGDIADVGEPMNNDFIVWIQEFRCLFKDVSGKLVFPPDDKSIYGFADSYKARWPEVAEVLAQSFGIGSPYEFVQGVSGRSVLDCMFTAFSKRALELDPDKQPALILDPLAWSGYEPLAKHLGFEILNSPVAPGKGLQMTAEGLQASLEYIRKKGLVPAAIIPILPSNPTGIGMEKEELKKLIEIAAAADVPVMIDGFYAPLDPRGHGEALSIDWIEGHLPPKVLQYLGLLVGETKVVSSSNRTSTAFWLAPKGNDFLAKALMKNANNREQALCAHVNPEAALTAAALHHPLSLEQFRDGIHEMMGPRYVKLNDARQAILALCNELGLPLVIGGSFYGTVALVDSHGQPLIQADSPKEMINTMVEKYGLVGAPGMMFRPWEEAATMLRLSAASTLEDIKKLGKIFERMLDDAR